ncbi:hypothetical protein AGMMS49975_05890 [Clostridia bacterium]|nr:hypothetical protein AGMMS49975_05890 [Clostridia bacterium]
MKTVRLYETEIKTLLALPDEQRGKILTAILSDCIGADIPNLDPMEAAVYTLVNSQVKRAEQLSNKRKQSVNSRWNSDTNSDGEIQDDTNDIQNDTNSDSEDTKPYTNTVTNTVTLTNTVTNTNTDTVTSTPTNTESSSACADGGGGIVTESKQKPKKSVEKKVKIPKTQFAEFVSMTDAEHSALVTKLGEQGTARCIELLDNYKGQSGKKYDSDYRAILNWVIKRYEEELAKTPNRQTPNYSNQQGAYRQQADANRPSKNPFINAVMGNGEV